ncbi:MAG: metallophosphoesterase [Tunicatimonas sp.]|uniref:metallophosphoesterase n=1 Tax=Tunicatimonas sp. TaxID=1940096 RepID=UPI003C75A9CE
MQFDPQKMVGWYQVKQLIFTGLKALLSYIFGNYSDRREVQAALSGTDRYDFSEGDELWFDYVADVGDGFSATYSVAKLLAQPQLTFSPEVTQRGRILVMGGDQVYPTPEMHEYENRLKGPYQSALSRCDDQSSPALFAIPGNHDWYDGLTNFLKVFCQERFIGAWQTHQKRSYWAIQLPHRYWIWGIDIQLNSDIDQPQKSYFSDIVDRYMQPGDSVILCTAEPSWVFKDRYRLEDSYERLRFFEQRFILDNQLELVATLSGDLHHYARYAKMEDGKETMQRITAGGGGAFLHPTHNLNNHLRKVEDEDLDLKAVYPDKETSRKLGFKNILFPYLNPSFSFFLGVYYLLLTWVLETDASRGVASLLEQLGETSGLWSAFDTFFHVLIRSPLAFILGIFLVASFTWFADENAGKSKYTWIIGFLHGGLHLVVCSILIWGFATINLRYLELEVISVTQVVLFAIEMMVIGSICGGILVGLYLLASNLVLGIHDNESFSALHEEGYKNFLRFHLTPTQLTLYSIGIKRVNKNWERKGKFAFSGQLPKAHLIEPPVVLRTTRVKKHEQKVSLSDS